MNNFRTAMLTVLSIFIMASCDNDDSDFAGTDGIIASFALEQSGSKYYAALTTDSIIMVVPQKVAFTEEASALVIISENATISPEPSSITNWNVNMEFVVRSYNGKEKTYKYAVKKTEVIHNGNVTLQTQADVDAFAESGITTVEGNLNIATIASSDTIKSLVALNNLKSVKYELNIGSHFGGSNLEGLENLESAAGVTIGTSYYTKMNRLTDVALPSLKKVNNNLILTAPSAKTIALPLLQFVGGNLTVNNDSVYTYSIPSLETVGGEFALWYSRNIKKLESPKLKEAGSVLFAADTQLSVIDFPLLESMEGRFYIGSMGEVKVINMPSLISVGSMDISASKSETVNFKSLVTSHGNLFTSSLKGDIDLSSLTNIKGAFYVPEVTNTLKLGSLTVVEGILSINVANDINTLAGFEKLTQVQSLSISGSENSGSTLTGISGLESLSTVAEGMSIYYLPALVSLSGLSSLTSVGSLSFDGVGFTHLSAAYLPPKLKRIGALSIWRTPIAEVNIKGMGVTGITLDYISGYTEKTEVIGDAVILDDIYIEDAKKVDFTGIEGVKNLTIWPNGTRGYGIEISGIKKAETATLYHGRDYLIMDIEEITGKLTLYDKTTLPKLKVAGSIASGSTWSNTLPELATVNGDFAINTGNSTTSTSEINLPKINVIEGALTIKGNSSNTNLVNLDGLSTLTKVASILIQNNKSLIDYTGLSQALSAITEGTNWITSGNDYNPTYQDMKDGKWVKP